MQTRNVTVQCEQGLHLRVAAQVANAARKLNARVTIHCRDCPKASACSVLELLMLGAAKGTELEVEAEGADEKKALSAMREVFEHGGGI